MDNKKILELFVGLNDIYIKKKTAILSQRYQEAAILRDEEILLLHKSTHLKIGTNTSDESLEEYSISKYGFSYKSVDFKQSIRNFKLEELLRD